MGTVYDALLGIQQQQADIAKTQANTADIGSQTKLRGAQTSELLDKLTYAKGLREAMMNAQQVQGPTPTSGDTSAPTGTADDVANATGSTTPAPGQTIGQPTGMSAQAAAIKQGIASASARQKYEQNMADMLERKGFGDSPQAKDAKDNARQWQTQIDAQNKELTTLQGSMAEKLAATAGAAMDNGANLPQVLADMEDIQPGVTKKIPFDRDPATNRIIWSPKTAMLLKTTQNEGLKAMEQYTVQNEQVKAAQAVADLEERRNKDAQEAAHQDGELSVSRENAQTSKDRLQFERDKSQGDTRQTQLRAASEASTISNRVNAIPSVKWMNTNMPAVQQVTAYADGVQDGSVRQTPAMDQKVANTFLGTDLNSFPRSKLSVQAIKDQFNIGESMAQHVLGIWQGKTLPTSVLRDMTATINKTAETQRADAITHTDQAGLQLNELGVNPTVYLPRNIPRRDSDGPVPYQTVAPKEQKTITDLLGK